MPILWGFSPILGLLKIKPRGFDPRYGYGDDRNR